MKVIFQDRSFKDTKSHNSVKLVQSGIVVQSSISPVKSQFSQVTVQYSNS